MKYFSLSMRLFLVVLLLITSHGTVMAETLYGEFVMEDIPMFENSLLNEYTLYIRYDDDYDSHNSSLVSMSGDVQALYARSPTKRPIKQVTKVVIEPSVALKDVVYMNEWFKNFTYLRKIEGLQYINEISSASSLFENCIVLDTLDLSMLNAPTSNADKMFYGCTSLKCLDLSGWKIEKNTMRINNLEQMFQDCTNLETIYCENTWEQYASSVSSTFMFKNCTSLRGAISYQSSKTDMEWANPVTGYFTIKPVPLGIKLADQDVTNINCNDLTAISGVTGTASYDPDTKTLYLEDASITELTSTGGYALYTTLDTLRINVTGDCSISSSKGVGLHSNSRNVVIGGTGTLDITAGTNGIVMNNTSTNTLDIDGKVTVNVTADNYGVQGREYEQRQLGGTTRIYYRTTLKVGGEGSKLSVNGTAKCFQTLGGFIPADGYEVTAPSRTAFYGTSDGVDYYTFCRLSLSFGKDLSDPTPTLTPVVGTAVVIEKPYILGDVNGDGSITMADANMVVNYFLATDKPEDFNVAAADVNEDGTITMADANKIVNMFLGQ